MKSYSSCTVLPRLFGGLVLSARINLLLLQGDSLNPNAPPGRALLWLQSRIQTGRCGDPWFFLSLTGSSLAAKASMPTLQLS